MKLCYSFDIQLTNTTDATYQNMRKLCNAAFFVWEKKIEVIDPLGYFSIQLFSLVEVVTLYVSIASGHWKLKRFIAVNDCRIFHFNIRVFRTISLD